METNESILSREIVAIDDRKRMGKMRDLCVDCNTRAVSYYIVNSATTSSPLVLPFEKSIAVGDTFMTIQSRNDFLVTSDDEAKIALDEGYRLVGCEVYSKSGNRLGQVEGYEFDPVFGVVTKIVLGKRSSFDADTFIFFSPEFVFVDDGDSTAEDLRSGGKDKRKRAQKTNKFPRKTKKMNARLVDEVSEEEAVLEEIEVAEEVVIDKAVAAAPQSNDDVLKGFLVGSKLTEDVASNDGQFSAIKGTILTKELIDEADAHGALLLLTMSVEE